VQVKFTIKILGLLFDAINISYVAFKQNPYIALALDNLKALKPYNFI